MTTEPQRTLITLERESPAMVDALPLALQRHVDETGRSDDGGIDVALLSIAIEQSPEGVLIVKPVSGNNPPVIVFANRAYCRMAGLRPDQLVGQPLEIFRMSDADLAVRDALEHPVCQRKAFEGEGIARRSSGSHFPLEMLMVPIHDENSEVRFFIAYVKDVSEKKAQLAALQQQAMHDVLTQLPNRTLFVDRVEQAILVCRRTTAPLALMILDLDSFKVVNDTYGHHAGDLLLQQVARRLSSALGVADTVARLGGDEFAFVLPTAVDSKAALTYAREILHRLEEPFVLDEQKCEIGASIGVAMCPEQGDDVETLMRRADLAMYVAKRKGRGVMLYSAEHEQTNTKELALTAELREAIARNQLRLFYQPKVHLRTGLVTRVEALVRWMHPERGLLAPDSFIPLAERTGLIQPMTDWVLDTALRQVRAWQDRGLPIHVAVNMSNRSLQESFLPQTVQRLLDKWNVPPRALKLEITESSIMSDPSHVLAVLSLLQTMGIRLSLDDFGTGYSSLIHLRMLPVDEIKIDKSFIMGMATSASDAAIVRATIDLAHNLGRQVVAEGVEDARTCWTLAQLGCDLAQGFCLSEPLATREFEQWLVETSWGVTKWQEMMTEGAVEKPQPSLID